MSSLGLPGPSNTPPGDAALHRSWNRFLDAHNLRTVFQASPALIDRQCADALAALRAPDDRRAAVEDAVLRLWDRIGLVVDCLPPDVNPHWRAEEQLLKRTALRLAARRARRAEAEAREGERRRGFWGPMPFAIDMAAPAKSETLKEQEKKKKGKDEEEEETNTKLEVATSLVNTDYFLGHAPGDPIFSYDPLPRSRPADECNFTYRGRVPRDPREDLLRLQLLLPRVLAQLVALLAFSPEDPSAYPADCRAMMDQIDDDDGLGDDVLRKIRRCWRAKFGGPRSAAAPHMRFLRGSPLVRELAWLVHRACLDDDAAAHRRSPEEARRARGLWATLLPVVDALTSDRAMETPAREALLHIAELHAEDEGRRARDMVFREGEYGRALVYREGAVINKSIHALYASHIGRLRPAASVSFRTTPHPLFPRDPDLDDPDRDHVPIPDEVLAAYESIRARLDELPPKADVDRPASAPRPDTVVVVAAEHRRKRAGEKDAAADREPPRKKARR